MTLPSLENGFLVTYQPHCYDYEMVNGEGRKKSIIFIFPLAAHVNRSFNNLTVDDIKGARPNPKVSMVHVVFIIELIVGKTSALEKAIR